VRRALNPPAPLGCALPPYASGLRLPLLCAVCSSAARARRVELVLRRPGPSQLDDDAVGGEDALPAGPKGSAAAGRLTLTLTLTLALALALTQRLWRRRW
jgi:hypothetical protein